ncbi:MAG: hypothetical protein QME75_08805 [Deltaproteobacteria bacterium]|nr:hypothetical protein [Deltaproteobacteria bacterium]
MLWTENRRNSGPPFRQYLAKIQLCLAPVIWVAAFIGALWGLPLFKNYLYFFAWWPLIFFLDSMLFLAAGESWLFDKTRDFVRLAAWSVTVWLIFECFNLYLLNWRYIGIEPRMWVRWPGYALAFATVLPVIFLTAQALKSKGFFRHYIGRPLELNAWQPVFLIVGSASLVLPVVFSHYAFPLIWLSFIFLLDPFNDLLSGDSLTRRWLRGERQEHLCLLAAGLLCGLWWELWNYPAAAKWIYTLPLLNFGKVFEMPVLGYLGFPVFALECAVMYNFLLILDNSMSSRARRLAWLGQAAFWAAIFWAIDARTVLWFR